MFRAHGAKGVMSTRQVRIVIGIFAAAFSIRGFALEILCPEVTFEQELENSDLVFVGKSTRNATETESGYRVNVEVLRKWKGQSIGTVGIVSGYHFAIRPEVNQYYLYLLKQNESSNLFHIPLCVTGMIAIELAGEQLLNLGSPVWSSDYD